MRLQVLASRPVPGTHAPSASHPARAFSVAIGRLAVRSLHAELTLYPKPGLVSPHDNGSHRDMDAATFMRSLFALRHFFTRICRAGHDDAGFDRLKQLGKEAETRMLAATAGVNTHRGAIFSLGLLCAAAGRAHAQGSALAPAALRATLLLRWGQELAGHRAGGAEQDSHGLRVAAVHAASGAREEAALGLPSVFEVALPALQRTLQAGRGMRAARLDALFALMAQLSDTNVWHRGGANGANTVKEYAAHFIALGGSAHPAWHATALACHHAFVARRLSPGGAADLLAATCLVHAVASGQFA